ncbi:MAG TPA: transaldolase [Longimicrobiaceae bacterium]|nr:transaldolase [Longimicrobiaceae bacterium]
MSDTLHPASEVHQTGPLWALTHLGQSVWLDYIRRGILENGELERMIRDDAVRGVTSNPAIFEQAIGRSDDYDDVLSRLADEGLPALEVYERLAIEDIQRAADLFRDVYEGSRGADGFVSLEVSPELAHDTDGSLEEARRLWSAVGRPNVMIKIPGTEEGLPAIEEALYDGINVNITLLFSLEGYERVMQRYLRALERRAAEGRPLDRIASVASFFVSRVDTAVDAALEKRADAIDGAERERILGLRGKAAVANAKLAYRRFEAIFGAERFATLRERGAHVQRPLWASTSTKNPEYRDVIYVEELIGPDTVNTMPLATLEAFGDHGRAERTVDRDVAAAERHLQELAALAIDMAAVTHQLQVEGVEKFVVPFRDLLRAVEEKVERVASGG